MKSALTIGDVLAACRAVQRLPGYGGGGRFGALQVVRVAHWPKLKTERTEVKRLPAHLHIVWLVERLRWLPRRWAWFEYDAPIFADAAPVIDEKHGLIYCSDAQADALRREVHFREQRT